MGGDIVVTGRPARVGGVGERGRVGKGDRHRPLLGLCGVVVFWLCGLQIQEAHGVGLAFVGTSPCAMTWQATVVAQVTSNAAIHLSWFNFQDPAAGSIDVHGDDLQVRGNLLGKLISSSDLAGDVCRFGGSVQTAGSHAILHLLDKGNVVREGFRRILHLEYLSTELRFELLKECVDAGVVRPRGEGLDNGPELDGEV